MFEPNRTAYTIEGQEALSGMRTSEEQTEIEAFNQER